MIRKRLIRRLIAPARLLPVLAWLMMQLSMAAMPITASAATNKHPPEIAALLDMPGVDRIVLCTPEGRQVVEKHDDHALHAECPWCQGFSQIILPRPPGLFAPVELSASDAAFRRNAAVFRPERPEPRPPARAPPAPVQT